MAESCISIDLINFLTCSKPKCKNILQTMAHKAFHAHVPIMTTYNFSAQISNMTQHPHFKNSPQSIALPCSKAHDFPLDLQTSSQPTCTGKCTESNYTLFLFYKPSKILRYPRRLQNCHYSTNYDQLYLLPMAQSHKHVIVTHGTTFFSKSNNSCWETHQFRMNFLMWHPEMALNLVSTWPKSKDAAFFSNIR